jgi:hypothetical protein
MRPFLPGDEKQQLEQSKLPPPKRRTHKENMKSGKASEESPVSPSNPKHPSKRNGKKAIDVFSRMLPYWDGYVGCARAACLFWDKCQSILSSSRVTQFQHCPMHLIANVAKDVMQVCVVGWLVVDLEQKGISFAACMRLTRVCFLFLFVSFCFCLLCSIILLWLSLSLSFVCFVCVSPIHHDLLSFSCFPTTRTKALEKSRRKLNGHGNAFSNSKMILLLESLGI